MKDEQTLLIMASINSDSSLDAETKLELIAKLMMDCKQKKIGKIITDAIKAKQYYPQGPLKKVESGNGSMDGFEGDVVPTKKSRGRPKGSKNYKTTHQEKMIQTVKENPRRDF